jgi:hypothetical protein
MKKTLLAAALILTSTLSFADIGNSNSIDDNSIQMLPLITHPHCDPTADVQTEGLLNYRPDPLTSLYPIFFPLKVKGVTLKDGDSIKVSSGQINQIFVPEHNSNAAPISVFSKSGDIEYAVDRNVIYVIPTVKTPVKIFIHTTSGPVGITLIPSPMIQSITATITS